MRGKVLYIREYDYNFLIGCYMIFDGESFEWRIPKSYHIVKAEATKFSQTVYVSKKNDYNS